MNFHLKSSNLFLQKLLQNDKIITSILKEKIIAALATVKDIAPAKRVENRIEKYSKMGFWEEA